MNSSETTTELSNVPDSYQIEVKASPKFNDINFSLIGNDTATQLNNDTFTFQGNVKDIFLWWTSRGIARDDICPLLP